MRLVLDTKVLVSGLLSLTDAYPILTPVDFVNRFMS
jgi:predicted nucleic acid-binding protein